MGRPTGCRGHAGAWGTSWAVCAEPPRPGGPRAEGETAPSQRAAGARARRLSRAQLLMFGVLVTVSLRDDEKLQTTTMSINSGEVDMLTHWRRVTLRS